MSLFTVVNMFKTYVRSLIMFLLLISCNEYKIIDPRTVGYDYYPIEIGQYRIYNMEEIIYRITGFDTSVYQLRETIFDSISSRDQITYIIRRDVRNNETEEWVSDSTWSITKTNSFLSIRENNIPLIKLSFPVSIGNEWNGNSLNNRNNLTYRYESVDELVIDTTSDKNHVKVIIADIEQNITGMDLRSEIYVRRIGLVEKDYLTLVNCTAGNCGGDLGKVVAGRSLKQLLIATGVDHE